MTRQLTIHETRDGEMSTRNSVSGLVRRCRAMCAAVAGVAWLASPSSAFAQVAPALSQASAMSASRPSKSQGKWAIEIHGGGFGDLLDIGSLGKSGGQPFPAGTPFTSEFGTPSAAVTSWMFGDGAALFNAFRESRSVDREFNGIPFRAITLPSVTPLDSLLRSAGTVRTPGKAFGVRFSRDLAPRFALEFAYDRGRSRTSVSDDATRAIEATRVSYVAAFEALLAGRSIDPRVNATATLPTSDATNTQTIVTGSAVVTMVKTSRIGVHAVFGGGLVTNDSSPLDVRVDGGYQFGINQLSSIEESETIAIRFAEKPKVPVGVLGLGFTVRVMGNSGVRVDARMLASESAATTTLSASASRGASAGRTVLMFVGTPSIAFSPDDRQTTLSGGAIDGLVTHTGGGYEVRPQVTVGYFLRF